MLSKPVPSWLQIEHNPVSRAIRRAERQADAVARGEKLMQLIAGPPGWGKSELFAQALKRHGRKYHKSSPKTLAAFVDDLWRHRNKPFIIEDAEGLAQDSDLLNIVKSFWGPAAICVVPQNKRIDDNEKYRLAGDDRYDPHVAPPEFRRGKHHCLLWSSNHDYNDPKNLKKDCRDDFAALISRGLTPIWIPADKHPQHAFDYTLWMIVVGGMLRVHPVIGDKNSGGFNRQISQEVIDFFCTHAQRLPELTPRLAFRLAEMRRSRKDWRQEWDDIADGPILWPMVNPPAEFLNSPGAPIRRRELLLRSAQPRRSYRPSRTRW